ncbi:CotD family spore coat protein [Lysinibacillus sp. 3P01SB]|uniref:CotD family spore coat protein n=1 Tax=Lysinibacillus sp. 3P01SB TaxID=3132284 RepID=UPI0039A53B9C
MYGGNWFNQGRNGFGQSPYNSAPQVFPDTFEQPIVSPTREFVRTNIYNTYVPRIHPSHTTTVNRHMIHNQHFFPHTESVVNECFETNTICGMPQHGCGSSRKRRF